MMREGSLFTGTNALGMAAAALLGSTPAWFSEFEPPTEKTPKPEQGGAKLLAHHYPNVPNHGDITEIDWSTVEPVEVLTGGWPCQPWSAAGKRKGTEDERALWPYVDGAIRALRPRYVLLENVPRIITAGEFARVADTLASCGYRFGWVVLGAGEVGAPHKRDRCFIAAVAEDPNGAARAEWRQSAPGQAQGGRSWPDAGGRGGALAADPTGDGWHERRPESAGLVGGPDAAERSAPAAHPCGGAIGEQPVTESGCSRAAVARLDRQAAADADCGRWGAVEPHGGAWQPDTARRDRATTADTDRARRQGPESAGRLNVSARGVAADPDCDGCESLQRVKPSVGTRHDPDGRSEISWGQYEPAIQRWEAILGRAAPAPTVVGTRGGRVLNPALPEWMMGLPGGWITAVPGLSRNAQLKLAGNGVVPLQAITAYRFLLGALGVSC